MPAFLGVDFIGFDSLLSDEEKLVRRTARQFVDDEARSPRGRPRKVPLARSPSHARERLSW
jgi:hypothetical protein